MKRLIPAIAAAIMLSSCSILTSGSLDSTQLSSAAGKVMTAASLTDAQIAELSRQSVAELDRQNTIDNGAYIKRLNNIMKGITKVGDMTLNFKVYKTDEVNAFACGDGSIRVYSGLMDVMTDEQVLAVIGHEIGHVMHHDSKNAMKKAYMASAARDAVSASGGVIGTLSQSVAGDLAESYLSAQFSQKQELAADEYGFQFAIDHGRSPYSMATALEVLTNLNGSTTQVSKLAKKFSSHPDSALRAAKMRAKADAYGK